MCPWRRIRWYDNVILSCLVSNIYVNCIVQDYDMGTIWHCALVSCTPSQSISPPFWGVGVFVLLLLFWGICLFVCLFVVCLFVLFVCLFLFVFSGGIVLALSVIMCSCYLYIWAFCDYVVLVLQLRTSLDVSAPGHSIWKLDWTYYLRTPLCHI